MKRFAFFSDLLFTFLASTLLALCAFRFINVGFWLSLLLAVLCGGLIMSSVGAYLQSKRKNLLLKRSDAQEKEKLLLHLALLSDSAKTEFFRKALSKNVSFQRFSSLRLHNEKQFYFLNFKLSPVNADDVAKYARLKTGKEKILLCGNIEESARAFKKRRRFTQSIPWRQCAKRKETPLETVVFQTQFQTVFSERNADFAPFHADAFLLLLRLYECRFVACFYLCAHLRQIGNLALEGQKSFAKTGNNVRRGQRIFTFVFCRELGGCPDQICP